MVEQRTENPRVAGSIPALGTIKINELAENQRESGVASAFDGSQAFSRPYHPLPNIPCNTDATRRSRNVPVVGPHPAKVETALDVWLSGFASENTRRAYRKEIEAFAAFAGHDDLAEAVAYFLALEDGQAHAVADKWRAEKIARRLSPASINRSMATLNSLVASTRRHGITKLRLEAKGVKSKPYRDTKGPGLRACRPCLPLRQTTSGRRRRRAIRRSSGLPTGSAFGEVRLPASTSAIVTSWARGSRAWQGPQRARGDDHSGERQASLVGLALGAWHRCPGRALARCLGQSQPRHWQADTGAGIFHIVRALGEQAGLKVRPHGLRHTAITAALDAFNGDYRKTRAFSRHASLDTVRRYDDNRTDHAGQVAHALDAILG